MKIALVGAHRATKLLAPYEDMEWDIWSCSSFNESELPRHDAWFELHDLECPEVLRSVGPVYPEWLKSLKKVYTIKKYPDIPGSVSYPLEEIIYEFGPYFFTGSISYMMALAILQKPSVIGLWGLSRCPEYSHQRPSILHFVQAARDRGIEVISPAFKELLDRPKFYGYE